jgi:Domain of unknown function (DUF1906)
MTDLWIDTAEDTTAQIPHLLADNVVGVVRYLTENTASEKCIKPAEAKALGAAGIRLALVFESGGGAPGQAPLSAVAGARDGSFVANYIPTLGAPPGLCVFFAADNDFSANQITTEIIPYFRAIAAVANKVFTVGAYGSGNVCKATIAALYAVYAWLSGSLGWGGSHDYLASKLPELVLVQDVEDTRLANMGVDTDYPLGDINLFSYIPFVPTPAVAAPAVAESAPTLIQKLEGLV